jgi:hypothetical protein
MPIVIAQSCLVDAHRAGLSLTLRRDVPRIVPWRPDPEDCPDCLASCIDWAAVLCICLVRVQRLSPDDSVVGCSAKPVRQSDRSGTGRLRYTQSMRADRHPPTHQPGRFATIEISSTSSQSIMLRGPRSGPCGPQLSCYLYLAAGPRPSHFQDNNWLYSFQYRWTPNRGPGAH